MSPTTSHERNSGRNAEGDFKRTKNTNTREIAMVDLQKDGREPKPSYGGNVPRESQGLLGEIIASKKLRQRTTKQSDQYVAFAQERMSKAYKRD
jgi:hypothetical protein